MSQLSSGMPRCGTVLCGVILLQLAWIFSSVTAEQFPPTPLRYDEWKHSGSLWLLTTPEGADLPASAVLEGVPLLVRLHKDFFDFRQALPQGEDLRFSLSNHQPLDFQIEDGMPKQASRAFGCECRRSRGTHGKNSKCIGATPTRKIRPLAKPCLMSRTDISASGTCTIRCATKSGRCPAPIPAPRRRRG